jgi:hypothetical protein
VVCPLNGTKVHRTFVCFRFALLRLKDQGNPSADFPFAGRKVRDDTRREVQAAEYL